MILAATLRFLASSPIHPGNLPQAAAGTGNIQAILSIVFGIAGALALLFITISGFRYILAGSDPQGVAKAKAGIIYALVGLVVAITAEAIVNFVVGNL